MENEVMTTEHMENDEKMIMDLTAERKTSLCSLKAKTPEEKIQLFNIMNNPEKRIADCINIPIEVTDIFVEVVTCVNQETGEVKECPRIVLIDKNGVGYTSVSFGIFSALKKVMQVFGNPTWKIPVKLVPTQLTKGTNKILTLNMVK